jgi:hypothetical protein
VKHFLIYTGLRIALFVASYAVLITVAKAAGAGSDAWLWVLVGAAVISSLLSLTLLRKQRDALAQSVRERAERAAGRFEEIRSREDVD